MRALVGLVGLVAACTSSPPALPEATPIADGVMEVVADRTGLYWTTDEGVYTQGTGPEPVRLAAVVPGRMFHDDTRFVFWDWMTKTLTVFPDTGGAVQNYDIPNAGTALCAVVAGAAYLQKSLSAKTLYRVDLSTGEITEQEMEAMFIELQGIDGRLYAIQGSSYAFHVDVASPGPLPLTFSHLANGFTNPTFGTSDGLLVVADNYETGHDFDTAGSILATRPGSIEDADSFAKDGLPNVGQAVGIGGSVWVTLYNDTIMRVDIGIETFAWDFGVRIVTDGDRLFSIGGDTNTLFQQPLP